MRILLVSPHLDDAVFSAGGTAALMSARNARVTIATAFTRSVHPATGFALACQRDKGLADEVDYMALRRAEDEAAARALGIQPPIWLDLPEAPHRGYETAAALFADLREDDTIAATLALLLLPLVAEADLVFAPQARGGHVDHRLTVRALGLIGPARVAWWQDSPYVARMPDARPDPCLPTPLHEMCVPLDSTSLARKITASQTYASQIGFQFGGPDAAARLITTLAQTSGRAGEPAERFLCSDPSWLEELAQ